jgi:hypothetical protein
LTKKYIGLNFTYIFKSHSTQRGDKMKDFMIAVIIFFFSACISFANDNVTEHIKTVFKLLETASTTDNYQILKTSLSEAKEGQKTYARMLYSPNAPMTLVKDELGRKIYKRVDKTKISQDTLECSLAIDDSIMELEWAENFWDEEINKCQNNTSSRHCNFTIKSRRESLIKAKDYLDKAYKICFPSK